AHGDRVVGARNIDIVHEIRAVERPGEGARAPGVAGVEPVERAGGRNRGYWEHRGEAVGDAVEFRAARHVARRIRSLDRYGGKRHAARRLERDAEEERPPSHFAAVFRRKRVDLLARDVAVGRGKIEVELDRVRHYAISNAM